jgi:hypothetical protein
MLQSKLEGYLPVVAVLASAVLSSESLSVLLVILCPEITTTTAPCTTRARLSLSASYTLAVETPLFAQSLCILL